MTTEIFVPIVVDIVVILFDVTSIVSSFFNVKIDSGMASILFFHTNRSFKLLSSPKLDGIVDNWFILTSRVVRFVNAPIDSGKD